MTRGSDFLALRSAGTGGWAIFSLILPEGGTELVQEPKALRRKRLAASASRVGLKRNSSVFPCESTARYRYIHTFLILMYVSSTFHESLQVFRCSRQRFSSSGA